MAPQIKIGKPAKMFVYLPVYLEGKKKPERIVIQDRMQLTTRIEVGDTFIVQKRDNIRELIESKGELKVEQVKHSFIDGSYIIVLEKMVFKNKEELSEFLKNKRSV